MILRLITDKRIFILNCLIIFLILLLPYYLFQGKFYIGGDDTKLFYFYPEKFLEQISWFSWYHFSSLGWNNPVQFEVPFLSIWYFLSFFIPSKLVLGYLAFSTPLIFGFVFSQKFLKELLVGNDEKDMEAMLGSLFFILSPILMINQLFNFLSTVWLLALIPILSYYFTRYLKTSEFSNVFKSMIFTTVFSISLLSVPWVLGFFFSLVPGFIVALFLYNKSQILSFIKKILVFFGIVVLSQSYWYFSFIMTYIDMSTNSFAAKVVSSDFLDTFTPTVLSTAVGTIIYPMFNLFHRQIAFNFGWDLKNVFILFYDKTFIINIFILIILFLGLTNFKKYLKNSEKKIFLIFLICFAFSLYFFTVNIGPLKDLFITFKNIPSFVALRNFYDKFALSYVAIYSIVIFFSLTVISRKFPIKRYIFLAFLAFVIFVNFLPVDKVVDSPLWGTKNVYRSLLIPDEYIDFMEKVKEEISPSNNILSVPFGSSIYSIIKDEDSNNSYVGSSPSIVFSGVNDISGHLSFNFTEEANTVDSILMANKINELNDIMFKHNINYIIHTKNIPKEVIKSAWVIDPKMFQIQDSKFLASISGQKIISSSNNNYELYSAKRKNVLVNSKNLTFQRISPVKYRLYIKNIRDKQNLKYFDSFHSGWKLYLQRNPKEIDCKNKVIYTSLNTIECRGEMNHFELEDISFLFKNSLFNDSHKIVNNFSSVWTIDEKYIVQNYDSSFYIKNSDGSIDAEIILYFRPQGYLYVGIAITAIVFLSVIVYLLIKRNEK